MVWQFDSAPAHEKRLTAVNLFFFDSPDTGSTSIFLNTC